MGEMMFRGISVCVEQVDTTHSHIFNPSCLYTERFVVIVWDYLTSLVRVKVRSCRTVVPLTDEAS